MIARLIIITAVVSVILFTASAVGHHVYNKTGDLSWAFMEADIIFFTLCAPSLALLMWRIGNKLQSLVWAVLFLLEIVPTSVYIMEAMPPRPEIVTYLDTTAGLTPQQTALFLLFDFLTAVFIGSIVAAIEILELRTGRSSVK